MGDGGVCSVAVRKRGAVRERKRNHCRELEHKIQTLTASGRCQSVGLGTKDKERATIHTDVQSHACSLRMTYSLNQMKDFTLLQV